MSRWLILTIPVAVLGEVWLLHFFNWQATKTSEQPQLGRPRPLTSFILTGV
jgi:hypothetical protein